MGAWSNFGLVVPNVFFDGYFRLTRCHNLLIFHTAFISHMKAVEMSTPLKSAKIREIIVDNEGLSHMNELVCLCLHKRDSPYS